MVGSETREITKVKNRLIGMEKIDTLEGYGKAFGNGSHIVLPRSWRDKKLRVQILEE